MVTKQMIEIILFTGIIAVGYVVILYVIAKHILKQYDNLLEEHQRHKRGQ
jgi:phage shock protein PspC (stress-responsive transcriptional regulator)